VNGVELVSGSVSPDQVGVDALHRTNVPNVFAAGDVCTRTSLLAGPVGC
jgi:pyruvate/2-oxoglutarate dehydrogenase complex dihydrolipoamide dehydrogenase (E3) component